MRIARPRQWGGVAVCVAVCGCFEASDVADVEPITGLRGEIRPPAGSTLDPTWTRVAAYPDRAAFDAGRAVCEAAPDGAGPPWRYSIELPPGAWFVDVWVDANADRRWGGGDLYAFHADSAGLAPVAVEVVAGHATPVDLAPTPLGGRQRDLGRLSRAKSQSIR